MDAAAVLAEFWSKTSYDRLPVEATAAAQRFIIDSVGVALAGSGAPGNREIMDLIADWGGTPEADVMVYSLKVPAPHAAFANGVLIHSADYDDTDDRTATHTNVSVLPAALAAAQRVGGTGRDVITAVTLGVDFVSRLALSSNLFHGWHNTTTVGVFGAAAAAGVIFRLSSEQLVNALGIAYAQASGNRQGRHDGAQIKRIQPAMAAKAGLFSVLLAKAGLTGAQNVFQGPWGFFRLYHDHQKEFDPEAWARNLTEGLGDRYENTALSAKPYPCVRCSHASIDAALALAAERKFRPEDIDRITVKTNERVIDTAGGPFRLRTNPEVDAKFSIPYVVAAALLRGRVTLEDFKEKNIRRDDVIALAKKVDVVVTPEFAGSVSVVGPVLLEARLADGTLLEKRIELANGHPDNPMNEQDELTKFKDCAAQGLKPLSEERMNLLLERLRNLEEERDIGELLSLTSS